MATMGFWIDDKVPARRWRHSDTKMKTTYYLIILFLIGLPFIFASTYISDNADKTIELVECYDQQHHEIVGLECEVEHFDNIFVWTGGISLLIIGMFCSILGAMLLLLELLMWGQE